MERDKMSKESRDELLERILEETARNPYKSSGRSVSGSVTRASSSAGRQPQQVSRQPVSQSAKPQVKASEKEQNTQVFSNTQINSASQGNPAAVPVQNNIPVPQENKVMEPDLTQVIPAQRDFDLNAIKVQQENNELSKPQEVTPQEIESAAEKIQKIKQEKAAAAKAAIMQKAEIDSKRMMQQNAENNNSSLPQELPVFTVSDDEKVNIVTADDGYDYDYDNSFGEEADVQKTSVSVRIQNIIQYALYLSFIVIVVFTYIFSFASISGDSMLPTLGDGEKILALETGYTPKRGDVVIIDSKTAGLLDEKGNVTENEALNIMISKRIIALGGDTIDFDFENGTVTVNGELLEESYISEPTTRNDQAAFEYPLTIPQGYVFVLGDNRNISMDSRHEKIGLVPEDEITGKAVLKVYPFGSFGAVN